MYTYIQYYLLLKFSTKSFSPQSLNKLVNLSSTTGSAIVIYVYIYITALRPNPTSSVGVARAPSTKNDVELVSVNVVTAASWYNNEPECCTGCTWTDGRRICRLQRRELCRLGPASLHTRPVLILFLFLVFLPSCNSATWMYAAAVVKTLSRSCHTTVRKKLED